MGPARALLGLPDDGAQLRVGREYLVVDAGDEWEAGTAYPTGDGPALVYCERVRGRHVWVRRATYAEAVALGVTP